MNTENELNAQPTQASEVQADVQSSTSSTLYQSILAEPLLTTVLCYATCLLTAGKALAYLKQNCLLTDADLRIGFSDRTLGAQLPSPRSKPRQSLRAQLQTADALKSSGHETFRGMVTVPLLSTSGTVTGVYGRRIDRHALGEAGTGRTNTERYEIQGPVALLMTTTSPNIDPELLNRCLVIAIDESCSQTAAIQTQQRFNETREGYVKHQHGESIAARHRNAQRLLRPLPVFNPYAAQLSFIGWQTRHRRDHGKYLTLIKAIALLHQYQREVKQMTVQGQTVDYLEVTRQDIALANQIADGALGRSIDELAEPTRRLLVELYDWIRPQAESTQITVDEVRFTRRAVRGALGWGSTQLAFHLERLCREEYVVRAAGTAGKLCQYQLLYDGRGCNGQMQLLKLTDATMLTETELPSQESAPTAHYLSA